MPVQRVPRYVMLLADFLKRTEESHPDFRSLSDSLLKMKSVADAINAAMKNSDKMRKFFEIEKLFEGVQINGGDLIQAHRNFVMEGPILKQCRKDVQKRYMFLFSDCLVCGIMSHNRDKFEVSRQFGLEATRVIDIPNNGATENAFQIQGTGKSFLAMALTPKEKTEWVTVLNTAIEEEIRRRSAKKEERSSTELAPIWTPDQFVDNCPLCDASFTVIHRKHHCRKCGTVVCADCSKDKLLVPSVKEKKVRVCDNCFTQAQPKKA